MIQNIQPNANSLRVSNSNVPFSPVSRTGYSSNSVLYAAPTPAPASKPWYSIFTNCFSKVTSFFSGIFESVKTYFCGPKLPPALTEKDKAAKFLDLVKNGAAGTADEKQAFGTLFATLKPEFQNVIKRLIWIAGGSPNFNGDFSEDKLKNDPKNACVSAAVEKFINNFDKYNGLAEFEAVVNDATKTSDDVMAALVKLAAIPHGQTNVAEAVKYEVYAAVGNNSNVPDFSTGFIKANWHDVAIKNAITEVRNNKI